VVVTAKTGAEMEALVACSTAALALYDMVKAVEREAEITDLRLERKSGGRRGEYRR
jgi:molybdenum cofactor biosynthesis enzyme